tara:strand:- start:3790 stop:3933 length:144 start_codon:yes stop_codon:yes gene_type:complete
MTDIKSWLADKVENNDKDTVPVKVTPPKPKRKRKKKKETSNDKLDKK